MITEILQRGRVEIFLCILAMVPISSRSLQGMSLLQAVSGQPCGQSVSDRDEQLVYQVREFFSPRDRNRFTILLVTVDPKNFNRRDMTALAMRLKKQFPETRRLKAALLDDDNVARLMATGKLEYPEFEKAQRGLYYRDRIKGKEYIQFSDQKGKPKNSITISLKG